MNHLKKIILMSLIIVSGLTFSACQSSQNTAPEIQQNSNQVSYMGEAGQDALSLLKKSYQVETKDTSFGEMVTSINSKKAQDNEYWEFQINGKSSEIGASQYITKPEDSLSWVLKSF